MSLTCKFCEKECKNDNSLRNHVRLCSKNPEKQNHPRGFKGKEPWHKGLSKETNEKLRLKTEKIKKKYITGELSPSTKGKHISDEHKKAISDFMRKRYDSGWMPKAGRCKKIKYNSLIAGEISIDGSWELITAQYLDRIEVHWKRNKNRFFYINENGKGSYYTPDFYVEEWATYIEVKGYVTEKDLCKWKMFPHKLLVWKKEQINIIRNGGKLDVV